MKKISIFDKENWKKYLPQKIKLITENSINLFKEEKSKNDYFELKLKDVIVNDNLLQITWYQKTFIGPNDVNDDGEPDYLGFDIHMVKDNNGYDANPDKLKLNCDVTYGDAMVSQFTISKPGQIKVGHYTGYNSKYDKETFFGFDDDTIIDFLNFFNRFGFKLKKEDFKFIDKYKDSYEYKESTKYIQTFENFINKNKTVFNRI